jgi:hypothetical protein
VEVFRHLLLDHVGDVVVRDDSHEAVLLVHHGHGEQVVLREPRGNLLLVVVGPYRHDLDAHEVADPHVGIGENEIAEGDDTDEAAMAVHDVVVVDRLALRRLAANLRERLGHGEVGIERGVVGGHHRAGRVLRVAEQPADVLAVGLVDEREQVLHERGLEFPQEVHAVVVRHRDEDAGEPLGPELAGERLLLFRREKGGQRGLLLHRGMVDEAEQLGVVKLLGDGREARRMERIEHLGDGRGVGLRE